MSSTLENTTRASHSRYSNSSVGDNRDSTTKIIDITLITRGIISDYYNRKDFILSLRIMIILLKAVFYLFLKYPYVQFLWDIHDEVCPELLLLSLLSLIILLRVLTLYLNKIYRYLMNVY
jgi:hypothetical protein